MASAGVLYVWSSTELSTAVLRSRKVGIHRPEAAMRSTRSSAAGDIRAIQSPPSPAKHFCGAR